MAAAKAAQDNASINLGYTDVTSPITGRIGKPLVTEGALVEGTSATQMATVQQLDPIYIDFNQSTTDLAALRRAFASGKLQQVGKDAARATVVLEDGSEYPHPQALVHRHHGRPDHRSGQPARRSAEPGQRAAAGHVCAREVGAGRGRQGAAGAAAGAATHARRRPEPDAGQQGKQGRAGAGDHRRRRQDQLDRHQRPEGRRHGGGRGFPEDPPRRAGAGQPVEGRRPAGRRARRPACCAAAGQAGRGRARQAGACQARPGRRPEV